MDDLLTRLREGSTPGTYGAALRAEAAAEIERLRTALKQCGDEARAAFRGDLDESETLSDINNFVIKLLGAEHEQGSAKNV